MRCLECGYDLKSLHTPLCPECGKVFNPSDPSTYQAEARFSDWIPSERFTYFVAAIAIFLPALLANLAVVTAAISLGHWPKPGIDSPSAVRSLGLLWMAAEISVLLPLIAVLFTLTTAVMLALARRPMLAVRVLFLSAAIFAAGFFVLYVDPLHAFSWMLG